MSDIQDMIIRRLEDRINAGAMSAAAVRVEKGDEVLLEWSGVAQRWCFGVRKEGVRAGYSAIAAQ